ncbi:type II/IV secretion system protein [Candidatus Peregrinibacteria bacterium]|jgi:type II secretory ATPase GspE/PulE/Tfp pilus assembly ATPase PilB-like protein|nr:type II/IV secretion system protein [Candidatus Peregrinibacteria bacterium]MBT4631489.1 type II/IV secretion system protein [Candidatus Peregrinibacteria bacterium]MBT5516595.1 type II/IV secretion system protein [Candidatus Peregrinibacteria bacterium]MBT5823878.1 type II/IV secretion system protein [Candidatus Peregrinibacteria bacterium]
MDNSKLQALQNAIVGGNIPQLVMEAVAHAIELRSSDIHIEPLKNTVQVRFRIDGVLRRVVEYPPNIHPAVISRIKIMANLKIDEQRIPQDGRAQVTTADGRELDLRVSSLPTVNGEKIVMRIQDQSREIPTFEQLGIAGTGHQTLMEALALPNGIILTSGPTGSGKTTTLYSGLTVLNKPDVNILTIEDPVEIQLDGLNQSQVHPDIDYTFAFGLRTALRQDPDIIMVGEIRDRETVDVAIEASLTGHLVMSTIHTNSAVETLTRILNMGVPAFLMTATINAVIAQRLVRKLCEQCRQPAQVDQRTLQTAQAALAKLNPNEPVDAAKVQGLQFYAAGADETCTNCNGIGYRGRIGLFEVMKMTNPLREAILANSNSMQMQELAMQGGMVTLEQAGLLKALDGITSLEEVYSVARPDTM